MSWQPPEPQVFWGELAPAEHLVQIYDREATFLDSLEGFVSGGILAGEGVIVIASEAHRLSLHDRVVRRGIPIHAAIAEGRYIPLDAGETLQRFMRNGWPDDDLFTEMVTELMSRARGDGRPVRAFGEMVALLWADGHNAATIRLEHLWHGLCAAQDFSLFCAYPKSGFTQDASISIEQICAAHSRAFVE